MIEDSVLLDSDSNYGSDFDEDGEAQLQQLLDIFDAEKTSKLARHKDAKSPTMSISARVALPMEHLQSTGMVERPDYDYSTFTDQERSLLFPAAVTTSSNNGNLSHIESTPNDVKEDSDDQQTPLERFRTAPKKPLSVTDLVSPAWCELQYWYNLVKHGRIKQTPAMARGSKAHKALEDEVHKTVFLDLIPTREDSWGIKIWNIIQGLRTLRITGLTRELEVWGIINGQVVNGVIDELSVQCTDTELEGFLSEYEPTTNRQIRGNPIQTTVAYSMGHKDQSNRQYEERFAAQNLNPDGKIYLTDVKTRRSSLLPSKVAMRPTELQLMTYKRLLNDMTANKVDTTILFNRYNLKASEKFSESLISQLSALEDSDSKRSKKYHDTIIDSKADRVLEILTNDSLSKLWQLMIDEFRKTIPLGSISDVLRAQFRSSDDGSIIGAKTFAYDEDVVWDHINDEMRWWNGEREARGVDVEEAFKCRSCRFADECTWRLGKVEDAIASSKMRFGNRDVPHR